MKKKKKKQKGRGLGGNKENDGAAAFQPTIQTAKHRLFLVKFQGNTLLDTGNICT